MEIIGLLVAGLIIGLLGKFLAPGAKDNTPLWLTVLCGIGGVLIGYYVAAALGVTVTAAREVGPTAFEVRLGRRLQNLAIGRRLLALFSSPAFWLWLVVAAGIAYMAYFSYFTVVWHRSVRSGYDLAIEDNVLWNLTHGGPFFKAAPTLGPTGSHFGRHATLIAYLLVPIYALHQSAETLLVLQSAFLGLAAVPLFLAGPGKKLRLECRVGQFGR